MESQTEHDERDGAQTPSSSLHDAILQINEHKTQHELADIVGKIAIHLRFDYYHYSGGFTIDRNNRTTKTISSYPTELQRKYAQPGREKIDPIIYHSNARLTPIVWSELAPLSPEHQAFMCELGSFGLGNGISFPCHAKNGDLGILSFACAAGQAATLNTIYHSLAYGVLSATLLHDAMRQIVGKSHSFLQDSLTQRELECLRWVARGKSNWEISVILGISVHGVVHHVRNFMSKFDVSSRHDAVARAAACGLI